MLALLINLPSIAAPLTPSNTGLTNFDDVVLFTDAQRLVTLTNNHRLLPADCHFKGRVSANRNIGDPAPLDPISAMNWYIETSRKNEANYLLANARYESLWAYQCAANTMDKQK